MMTRILRVTIFDVEFRATVSWLLIATVLLGISLFVAVPFYFADESVARQVQISAILVAGGLISLLVHELGHLTMARWTGQRIEAVSPQVVGTLPDTSYEARNPASEVEVAIAGPAVSLLLTLLFAGLWWFSESQLGGELALGIGILALANLGLFVVSAMPGYPFDGGRIARGFVWYLTDDLLLATKITGYVGYGLIMALMAAGVLLLVTGGVTAVWGTWVLLTAFMINRSVGEGISHVFWTIQSRRLRVDDLFIGGTRRIQSSVLIDDAIERLLEGYQDGPMLVFDNEEAVGLVDLAAIRPVPRRLWKERTVGDVMDSLEGLGQTPSNASLTKLVELLPPDTPRIALISRNGRIIGATDRRDVVRRLQEYLAAERLDRMRRGGR